MGWGSDGPWPNPSPASAGPQRGLSTQPRKEKKGEAPGVPDDPLIPGERESQSTLPPPDPPIRRFGPGETSS